MTTPYPLSLAVCLSWLMTPLALLPAQCAPVWLPGSPAGGPAGDVSAVLALPGGDVIVGGWFAVADAAVANNLARWDGSSWQAFGGGTDAAVTCLATLPNGDIVAGGHFTVMDGVACSRIARFDGSSWSPLGSGLGADVLALLALPNGELIAGGSFTTAGAVQVNRIARWDGAAWQPLGPGFANSSVTALALRGNGDIVAAGPFLGSTQSGVLRWDGATWHQVNGFDPSGLANVDSLATLPNGDLVVGGAFSIGGVPQSVARWDGATLQALSPPLALATPRLLVTANGDLVVAGSVGTAGTANIGRWNGIAWSTLPAGPQAPRAIAENSAGDLLVGASTNIVGSRSHAVARYDGVGWQPLGAPLPPIVHDLVGMPNGDVIVGGNFTEFGGVAANRLARFDGTNWSPLGLGVDGDVLAMIAAPDGALIVSGDFQNAGGAPAPRIARFDGTNWTTLGAGLPTSAAALAVLPNGDVAALRGGVLRTFDGLAWSQVQVPGLLDGRCLAPLNGSDLAIGGLFQTGPIINGGISVLSGGTFTTLAGAPISVTQLLPGANGSLLAAGANGVRRFSGGAWTTLLDGAVRALDRMPNGDLLAGGSARVLPGSTAASALYRDTTSTFQVFGAITGGTVNRILVTDRGEVFAAGSFTLVDGAVAIGFAEGRASCAATAQPTGAGCSGGAGPVALIAQSRPWLGSTVRSVASGMTGNSLALQLVGWQPTASPLPGGAPGCSLLIDPVRSDLLQPLGGFAAAEFDLPQASSLIGQSFRLQVVGVELDPLGIVRLTSSNALVCTIGTL